MTDLSTWISLHLWSTANILASVVVVAIILYKLTALIDSFNLAERVGMGMLAAGMTLNIAPLMAAGSIFRHPVETPFDDWGSTLLRVGIAVYFMGRISRTLRHNRANEIHAANLEQDLRELRAERGR